VDLPGGRYDLHRHDHFRQYGGSRHQCLDKTHEIFIERMDLLLVNGLVPLLFAKTRQIVVLFFDGDHCNGF
jgi:hypothetical protein